MGIRDVFQRIREIDEQFESPSRRGPSFWQRNKPEIVCGLIAVILLLALLLRASVAQADTGLARTCAAPDALSRAFRDGQDCPLEQKGWTRASDVSIVLSTLTSKGVDWNDGESAYRLLPTVPALAQVTICTADIQPGINGTNPDPCPGDKRVSVPRAQLQVVAPAPPAEVQQRNAVASWRLPTQNTDGTPLTDLSAIRLEYAATLAGPWIVLLTTPPTVTSATPLLTLGPACLRAFAEAGGGARISAPSNTPCFTVVAPSSSAPNAPQILADAAPKDLSLFDGTTTGLRPVYSKTSTGARGLKIGDLAVGPPIQPATGTAFARVKCDASDVIRSGTTVYYRVIDSRAPTQYRAGYGAGCTRYGVQ